MSANPHTFYSWFRVPAVRPVGDPFDALRDADRRASVELLNDGERSVREIADALPISRLL